jgi:hypothetical protein
VLPEKALRELAKGIVDSLIDKRQVGP